MTAGRPTRTTPQQWVQAALDEIEAAGVEALAVQSVARRLGVSKGGFYHHFADRRGLLREALALWEQRFVADQVAHFDAIADPRRRLRELLALAELQLEPTVIVQLMAACEDPDVAAVLERATAARLGMLERIFRDLGFARAVARQRALLAYSAYLGLAQLRRQGTALLRTRAQQRAYVEQLEATLTGDAQPG